MRIVFLGTPPFSVPFLKALVQTGGEASYQVVGVVTQPDRPGGRGRKPRSSAVKLEAEKLGLPILQPERIRNNPLALEFLVQTRPTLLIVAAFGQLLPADFFNYPPLGALNIHTSLLPKYRGAAPVAHALMNGETETGVTLMKLDEGMDSGDILNQLSIPIGEDATTGEVEDILAKKGVELMLRSVLSYARGELHARPQDPAEATLAPRIQKEDGRIEWNRSSTSIHNLIRALNPRPTAFARFRDKGVKVWRSQRVPDHSGQATGTPGEVSEITQDSILVQCGDDGQLALMELQLENRKRLLARDFANGLALKAGERFCKV